MAYLLYITRAPHYASPARRRISADDFSALIARDSQLRRHPHPDATIPQVVPTPSSASTSVPASAGVEGSSAEAPAAKSPAERRANALPAALFDPRPESSPTLFFYRDGNICCKNPDEPAVAKLVQLATRFNAILQGEDGEIFTSAAEAPHVIQLSLFEPVSNRLRVRFPTRLPPRLESLLQTESTQESRAAQTATPELHAFLSKPRKRMPVGFPKPGHEPTAALRSLLTPVRPANAAESVEAPASADVEPRGAAALVGKPS